MFLFSISAKGSSFLVARLCKLRCFPPVALAWDATSGLHIFPNLYSETVMVDSSPALWSSTQGSEKTTVFLLGRALLSVTWRFGLDTQACT
ncbi:unnamed protein product [Camellia sinensis]